jgi:hypothetical protein
VDFDGKSPLSFRRGWGRGRHRGTGSTRAADADGVLSPRAEHCDDACTFEGVGPRGGAARSTGLHGGLPGVMHCETFWRRCSWRLMCGAPGTGCGRSQPISRPRARTWASLGRRARGSVDANVHASPRALGSGMRIVTAGAGPGLTMPGGRSGPLPRPFCPHDHFVVHRHPHLLKLVVIFFFSLKTASPPKVAAEDPSLPAADIAAAGESGSGRIELGGCARCTNRSLQKEITADNLTDRARTRARSHALERDRECRAPRPHGGLVLAMACARRRIHPAATAAPRARAAGPTVPAEGRLRHYGGDRRARPNT